MSAVPEFLPNLLHNARDAGSSELRRANAILAKARVPVEVPRARQGNLPALARAREAVRSATPSSFSPLANALLEASADVAACVDLNALFRVARRAGGMLLDQFPRIDGDDRKTKVTLFMFDPFDDYVLRSEPGSASAELGKGIVGHVAKTGRVLNLAIAEMADHPTNHLNPKKPDDALDPDEFWMSFQGDPTKDILCVPVYETTEEHRAAQAGAASIAAREQEALAKQTPEVQVQTCASCTWAERRKPLEQLDGGAGGGIFALSLASGKVSAAPARKIIGALHAERPSIRAHFRRQRSRQGKRKSGRQSRRKKASSPIGRSSTSSPSARERARNAPFTPDLEEALCRFADFVAAAVHQANHDAGNGFADQARRFREKRNMTRVFKTLERRARAAQHRRTKAALAESQALQIRVHQLTANLQAAEAATAEQREKVAEALVAREEAELERKRCQKELDLLIAKHRGLNSELSRCKAAALQGDRRLERMRAQLGDHHHPADLKEIEMLQGQVRTLTRDLGDANENARQQKIRRALGRLTMRKQAMTFHTWRHAVEEQRALKVRVRRLAARMMHRLLGATFDAWAFYLEEQRRLRALLVRAARKMQHRRLSQSWNSLLEYIDLRCWLRDFCTKMIARFEKKELAMGFGKWKSGFLEALKREEGGGGDEGARRSRRRSFCLVQ